MKLIKAKNLTKPQQELERFKANIENYHDLKHYLPPLSLNSEETEQIRQHGRDTSCCAFLFIFLLLITNVFVMASRRNVEDEYWVRQKVVNSLNVTAFKAIVDPTSAVLWMNKTLGQTFFPGSSPKTLSPFYVLVGPLVIRQCRSLKMDSCPRSDLGINNARCYYKDTVSGTKDTGSIGSGPESWRLYNDSTPFKTTYKGEFGTYDTTGYLATFQYLTADQFATNFRQLVLQTWLSNSTRVLFISANLYQPSYDLWVEVALVLEFSTNRLVNPTQFDVVTVQPNLYSRSPGATTADIFRVIFSTYVLYLYIGHILELHDGRRNIKHIISFQGIMDLMLVAMVVFSVAISLLLSTDEETLYNNNVFVDLSPTGNYYKLYNNANSITLTLIIVRILMLMTVNKRVYILMTTIQFAAKMLVSFLVSIFLVLTAFTLIGQSLWGIQNLNYYNYIYGFVSLLLVPMSHGDFYGLASISEGWTVFFVIIYFSFIVIFLFNTFLCVFAECYMILRLQEGYVDDKSTWTKMDILQWFVDWLPRNMKRKLFDRDRRDRRNDEEEEDEDKADEDEN
jgi:hypothetical protein